GMQDEVGSQPAERHYARSGKAVSPLDGQKGRSKTTRASLPGPCFAFTIEPCLHRPTGRPRGMRQMEWKWAGRDFHRCGSASRATADRLGTCDHEASPYCIAPPQIASLCGAPNAVFCGGGTSTRRRGAADPVRTAVAAASRRV